MSSRPLPITSRLSQAQFVGDLAQIFRRHKVPYGQPADLEHLAAHLRANTAFRSDLFSLCMAISHMSETDLSPAELLALVTCAATGRQGPPPAADLPLSTASAFLDQYEAWMGRIAVTGLEKRPSDPDEMVFRGRPHPFSAAASMVEAKGEPEPLRTTEQNAGSVTPSSEHSVGSLTLDELRIYLDEIEQRVTRLRPFLERVSGTSPVHSARQLSPEREFPPNNVQGESSSPERVPMNEPEADRPVLVRPEPETSSLPLLEPDLAGSPEQTCGLPRPEAGSPTRVQIFKGVKPRATSFHFEELAPPEPRKTRVEPGPFVSYAHPVIIPVSTGAKRSGTSSSPLIAAVAVALIGSATFLGLRALDRIPLDGGAAPFAPVQASPVTPQATAEIPPGRIQVYHPSRSGRPSSTQSSLSTQEHGVATMEVTPTQSTTAAMKPLVISGAAPAPATTSRQSAGQTTRLGPESAVASVVSPASGQPSAFSNSKAGPELAAESARHPISVPSPTLIKYALATPAPSFPALRQRPILDSSVTVQATVGRDGRVISAHALTGSSELAEAAVEAIGRWRFRPYLVDGTPAEVVTDVKFVFKAN